jgi:uncharacterized protein YjbI with pentapeptide repeats
MAKRQKSGVLNRLAGKKFVFGGKFSYGIGEWLKSVAEAQQGAVADDLDAKVDYLVLADMNSGKTIQKKALALNAKGATIQVIDADAFKQMAEPTAEEVLALLRAGEAATYTQFWRPGAYLRQAKHTYHSENLKGCDLSGAILDDIEFNACTFVGAVLNASSGAAWTPGARCATSFGTAKDCDFSGATGANCQFNAATNCNFRNATLTCPHFNGDFSGADFTAASLEKASFSNLGNFHRQNQTKCRNVVFSKANLKSASFLEVQFESPDFRNADLTEASIKECGLESANFAGAKLHRALLVGCKLAGADLTNADLTSANLCGADLSGANLAGANLKNVNLRGAKLDRVDLSQARNYDPAGAATGSVGPALTELDQVIAKAKRIHVTFRVRSAEGEEGDEVGIDSSGLKYGWGANVPQRIASRQMHYGRGAIPFSDAMLELAQVAGHLKVRYETVDVSSTKSPKGGKELRDLVLQGIAEAFAQELPPEEELAAATKAHRDGEREKGAADRERREKAKAEAEKQKEKAKKQIAKKVEKAVGKVSDVGSFLKALELRIEKPKIDKATKMLKASGFKLFNDVTTESVSGVVKSQTDPDLVYACRVAHDGQYSCCTQNLNVCGGLRGSICKHLLVLIIGLVQAGELDPTTIDEWIAKTHTVKAELDKELMGAIFIKYKGAEAGEVDWRPTETVPEDYYAL